MPMPWGQRPNVSSSRRKEALLLFTIYDLRFTRPMDTSAERQNERLPLDCGAMDRWQVDELPAPPPFGFRNMLKVIGPGAIMAATSIGGGEWLVGPAAAVKYSSAIFLIVTVAIVLQVVFNLEAIRYTLYTGEPIYGGIMRLEAGAEILGRFLYRLSVFFNSAGRRWPEPPRRRLLSAHVGANA